MPSHLGAGQQLQWTTVSLPEPCPALPVPQAAAKFTATLTEAVASAHAAVELRAPDQALLAGLDPRAPASLAKGLGSPALLAHIDELLPAWCGAVEQALAQPPDLAAPRPGSAEVGTPAGLFLGLPLRCPPEHQRVCG